MSGTSNRTIVQYGVYQFTEDELNAFRLRVDASVIRQPTVEYLNYKYQKPRSFYGYWQLMSGAKVQAYGELNFTEQTVIELTNYTLLATQLAQCINLNTFNTVAALADGLGATIIAGDPIPFPAPPFEPDRIVFKLFSNTTLVVAVSHETLQQVCGFPVDRETDLPPAGGENGTPPEPNPDDPPYDIGTPPYDEDTQDDGETYVPTGGDEEYPYPDDTPYTWTLVWHYYDQPSVHRTETGTATGPLSNPRMVNRGPSGGGGKDLAIEFSSEGGAATVTAVFFANVPLSEPDDYGIIESFSATH